MNKEELKSAHVLIELALAEECTSEEISKSKTQIIKNILFNKKINKEKPMNFNLKNEITLVVDGGATVI